MEAAEYNFRSRSNHTQFSGPVYFAYGMKVNPCYDPLAPSRKRDGSRPMEEFIARENIRRFERQLADSRDDGQRAEIQALLDAERRHLHQIRQARSEH